MTPANQVALGDDEYRRLLSFRTGIRRFLHWSEERAAETGLTPTQHQLLLAIRGSDDPLGPSIGEVADHLLLRHHSAVGLIDRAVEAGLVRRVPDAVDHRLVRLKLTAGGARKLDALSALHVEELSRLGPNLIRLWRGLERGAG